jgi:sugar phosphate permease
MTLAAVAMTHGAARFDDRAAAYDNRARQRLTQDVPMLALRRLAIFALFAIAYFLSYFFRSANAVIAEDLTRDLALSAAQLGLMTSLFYASFALVQLPLGSGLDRWGARFVTPGLMLVAAIGAFVFGSAQSFATVALGRALIGMGMAGVLMGAFKMFGAWFSPRRLATATGVLVGLGASGGLFAATPLAWLNAQYGWRQIFIWGGLVIAASAALIALGSRNTPPGVPWHAADSRAGGFGSIFRDIRFWRIAPLNFFVLGTVLAVQGLWGGPYLFDVLRLDPISVGNVLLWLGLGVVGGYFAGGWLADRFGLMRVVITGATIFVLCQAALVLPGGRPLLLLRAIYFLLGFTSSLNVILLAQIRLLFPPSMSGRAVTAVNLFGFLGTALIQWWMGLIISAWTPDLAGRYPPVAYAAAFLFTTAGSALALLWYLPMARRRRDVIATPEAASG